MSDAELPNFEGDREDGADISEPGVDATQDSNKDEKKSDTDNIEDMLGGLDSLVEGLSDDESSDEGNQEDVSEAVRGDAIEQSFEIESNPINDDEEFSIPLESDRNQLHSIKRVFDAQEQEQEAVKNIKDPKEKTKKRVEIKDKQIKEVRAEIKKQQQNECTNTEQE